MGFLTLHRSDCGEKSNTSILARYVVDVMY